MPASQLVHLASGRLRIHAAPMATTKISGAMLLQGLELAVIAGGLIYIGRLDQRVTELKKRKSRPRSGQEVKIANRSSERLSRNRTTKPCNGWRSSGDVLASQPLQLPSTISLRAHHMCWTMASTRSSANER